MNLILLRKYGPTDPSYQPNFEVSVHPLEFSGATTASKIAAIKTEIEIQKADFYLLSSLDEIAWLFNIRSCRY